MRGVDTSQRPEYVVFNGVKFKRMGGARNYYLSQYSTNEERKTKATGLHVAIFKFYSGKRIPKGCHVHHKDGDPFNNTFENLECLSTKTHARHTRRDIKKMSQNLERIRPLASQWHRSAAGKKWHKEHAKRVWGVVTPKLLKCAECGNKFKSPFRDTKFCSELCGGRNRTRRQQGWIDFNCVICGATYKKPRSRKSFTCSMPCANQKKLRTRLQHSH